MAERRLKKLFPNPFYVLLLVASTLFVVTVFAYLAGPAVREQGAGRARAGRAEALADWLDRHGPRALGAEVVVMIGAGFLAMATDRWFSPPAAGRRRTPG